jgi:formylglycine-generating enzyme required for sulfatase activity
VLAFALIGLSLLLAFAGILATVFARARYRRFLAALQKAGDLYNRARDAEQALRTVEPLRAEPLWGHFAWAVRAYALRMVNRIDEAERETLGVLENARTTALPWDSYNALVDTLTCAGRYEEALSVEGLIPAERRAEAIRTNCGEYGLIQINLAEAEVNLGRPEAALDRLANLDEMVASLPVAASGLGMQRAWILGLLGRGEEALAAAERCNRDALGTYYAAEYHFSRTFALLAVPGRLADAEAELALARQYSVRPSSTRNAIFLAARIADVRGELDHAEHLCFEAASHPHRWQGGDGLLFWGHLRARRGDVAGAREAWSLALERDPQSVSAREARARLVEHGGAPEERATKQLPPARVPLLHRSMSDALAVDRGVHALLAVVPMLVFAAACIVGMAQGAEGRALNIRASRSPVIRGGAVLVQGGEFIMGSMEYSDEAPPRLRSVNEFWLDRTEVTVVQYANCVDDGECAPPGAGAGCNAGATDRWAHPINCVDFARAEAFCAWAGGRLPTEEEWEYAAKGGSENRRSPWGDAVSEDQLCWRRDETAGTCAVGSFDRGVSRDGALDLGGNVREWTSSPYHPDAGTCGATRTRVVRGGSWQEPRPWAFRGAAREVEFADRSAPTLGFRCVYDQAPSDT